MTVVVERIEGRYEVHQMPCGKSYVWSPEYIVVECGCGQRLSLTPSAATCRCGTDHTTLIHETLATWQPLDAALHPWRDEYQPCRKGEHLCSEHYEWLELCAIE